MGSHNGAEVARHVQFEVLTSTNYANWAARTETTLRIEGLWRVVEVKPDSANLKDQAWLVKNARAKSFLCIALPMEMGFLAEEHKSAHGMWAYLAKMAEAESFHGLVSSWRKLCGMRMRPSDSVDAHIRKVKTSIGAVNAGSGQALKEIFQVMILVESLSPKFDGLKRVLMSQGRIQTWESVVSQIKSDKSGDRANNRPSLVIGRTSSNPCLGSGASPQIRSGAVDSQFSRSSAGEDTNSLTDTKCSNCAEVGGYDEEWCPKRRRDQKGKRQKAKMKPKKSERQPPLVDVGNGFGGTPDTPKRPRTNGLGEVQLARIFEGIVCTLLKADGAYLFQSPVSADIEFYLDYVKTPMDLGTIMAKAGELMYKCRADFRKDVEQIVTNAHLYNDGLNPHIPPFAEALLQLCDEELRCRKAELDGAESEVESLNSKLESF